MNEEDVKKVLDAIQKRKYEGEHIGLDEQKQRLDKMFENIKTLPSHEIDKIIALLERKE